MERVNKRLDAINMFCENRSRIKKGEIESRAYVEVNLCSFVFPSGATSQKKISLHLSCACETDL